MTRDDTQMVKRRAASSPRSPNLGLAGFDKKFKDFPDYILGITREIWEARQIHTLQHYYASDVVVRSAAGVVTGNQGVIAATLGTLAEFPDRTLLGEDVVWCGDPSSALFSSHRLLSTATHQHTGSHGVASGRRLTYRVIADCAARHNQIFDEWLIRDQGAIARQLGSDPKAFARDQIELEGGPQACTKPLTSTAARNGTYTGRGNDHEIGARYGDILARIMAAEMSIIPARYDRACHLELPGGFTGHGHDAADQFWMGLRAAFPSARFEVHHQIGRTDDDMPPRAALRWSLTGRHDGWGRYGAPSGAEVYVLGISHAEFGPRGLRREYVLIDDVAIWKQILLHTWP